MKKQLVIITACLLSTTNMLTGQENKSSEKCIPCEKLTELRLPDVKITGAVTVKAGKNHCKVTGVIGKEINFELLLPDEWNSIYVMGGGGGFVGIVQNVAQSSVNDGYATSGTDTGHDNRQSMSANWALNNMERQLNFGHLAVHRTAEVSKAIIGSYYGKYPDYSYFMGCSRGGGQAMMEAQRYPDDFNGIVAAAPAFDWPAIAAEFVSNTRAVYPDNLNEGLLSREHLALLQQEVDKQCDMLDGVKDGIINNPQKCTFNFDALPKCPADNPGKGCFTSAQIKALKQIYGGVDPGNGFSYPGFPYGQENKDGGWTSWIVGPDEGMKKSLGYPSAQAYFGIEVFKYLILQDPDWDYSKYEFRGYDKELRYAAAYLDATSTDYSGLKKRNGKIIFWHGWNDPALSALATIEHYNAVKSNDPSVSEYMRLFLLPGVLHCGGGDGPSQADWLKLIREWVETGQAPEKVIVTKSVQGKTVMARPVFPYPAEAVYDGKGDPDKEESYSMRPGE